MSVEELLRDRLAGYAETVTPGAPDLAGAAATARRLDRRRNRLVAVAAAVAVLATGAGVGFGLRSGSGSARVADQPGTTNLPGLAPLAPVTLPDGFAPSTVSADVGRIWVTGTRRQSGFPVLLHGTPGTRLTPLDDAPQGAVGAFVRGDRVYVSRGGVIETRDSGTGVLLRSLALSAYGMERGIVVASGDGTGPLVVVMQRSEPVTGQPGVERDNARMRVGVLAADGGITALTDAVSPRYDDGRVDSSYRIGDTGGLSPVITLDRGMPRYLIFGARRIDLATGAYETVTPARPAGATRGSGDLIPVGELDGHVVWDAGGYGTQRAPASSLTLTSTGALPPAGPEGRRDQFLLLAGGELFRDIPNITDEPAPGEGAFTPLAVEALDPMTLLPDGRIGEIAGETIGDGSTLATYAPADPRHESGGSLTVFAPVGSS